MVLSQTHKNYSLPLSKAKSILVSDPSLIRFSDFFRYTELAIILENSLHNLRKNIKHNSYLIKCHMTVTKPESIFKTY